MSRSTTSNLTKNEEQKVPKKVFHSLNEMQPVSTSGEKEPKSQNETASTEAGEKGLRVKTENHNDTLIILAKSERNNSTNKPIQFQDEVQTSAGDVIASIPVSSSVPISSSLSPVQTSSPHPPTHSPSSTPPPACSSCSSCLLRQLPSPLQGRFTPLLQDVALREVEEELGWVPSGDKLPPIIIHTKYTESQEANGLQRVVRLMTMWLWSSPSGTGSPSSPSS